MKLYVKSKEKAEAGNDLTKPHVIISISFPLRPNPIDEDEMAANPATNEYTKEVLYLFFSDVGRISNPLHSKLNSGCVPFNKEMAGQVIDLIERNKVEHIIAHCLMGMSRSASLADAISMYYNLEKSTSYMVVNTLVYITMLEELIKRNPLNYAPVV